MTDLPISAELYPDLIAAGGLISAVQQNLILAGSSLTVTGFTNVRFPVYARVERGVRSSQIYVAAHERLFLFDLWRDGVMYGSGRTAGLDELALSIMRWVEGCCPVSDLRQMLCIQLADSAQIFDSGEEVEHRWFTMLNGEYAAPELDPFILLASRQPALRQLFLYTSLMTLCFSRCTGYPYSCDCPHVTPIGRDQFQVGDPDGRNLGIGGAEFAVAMVLKHLPENCGPAIRGTAKQLKGT